LFQHRLSADACFLFPDKIGLYVVRDSLFIEINERVKRAKSLYSDVEIMKKMERKDTSTGKMTYNKLTRRSEGHATTSVRMKMHRTDHVRTRT
jgi:hypothetical protein